VRQINDAIRYAPISARYKVYILDEVHMLSPAAFNALLKTLEEPPPHAKFVFATTEVRKVPVTVLSRCQRFDLRRVEAGLLTKHLETIAAKERVSAEPDALALIARAADGSVRDALSLLDQAIAHAGSDRAAQVAVRAEDVRQMLGLADRARIVDLFEAMMRGDMAGALRELRDQYDSGADPAVVLADLAEFTHFVTRVKIVPAVAEDRSLSEAERLRGRAFAAGLSMRVLSRAWQMLFRGIPEVQSASKPIAAAEMVLVRIAYAADLPTPDEAIRSLRERNPAADNGPPAAAAQSPAPSPRLEMRTASRAGGPAPALAQRAAEPVARGVAVGRFEDLIALADEKRDLATRTALERDVRLVRFEDGKLEIALEPGAPNALVHELSRKLAEWTGRRWLVVVSAEGGAPSLRAQLEAQRSELVRGVRGDPLVQAVLSRFPGAEILDVRRRAPDPLLPAEHPGDAEAGAVLDESSAFGSRGAEDAVDDDF
jgi:DNA polymerase-3 subunit gamma/tau